MNILAIDTTSRFLCLGIYKQGRVYESNLDLVNKHSKFLIPKLITLLKKAKISVRDIDYCAVGLGPGSFTGIRIGLSTAKGLAYGLKIPLVGIPTLDILAKNIENSDDVLACPVIDAKRALVYSSIYKVRKGRIKKVSPYMLVAPLDLLKKFKGKEKIVFLGDGLALYKDLIIKKFGPLAVVKENNLWYPRAVNILKIALEMIKKRKFIDVLKVKPIYLYPKECQIRNA